MAWVYGGRSGRRLMIAAAAVLCGAVQAGAVTLTDLRDQGFESIFGDYAPGGDCSREPRLRIDEAGFTFTRAGRAIHAHSLEYAASFGGPDYHGISLFFFPFPISEDEPGHVLMTVNDNEQPGLVSFGDNLGPGESYAPLEADLVSAGQFSRCDPAAR